MHRLLERQLRKAGAADGTIRLDDLLASVDAAYEEADAERRLNRHALQVLQEEVESATRFIRDEAEARLAVVIDNIGEAVVTLDEEGIIEGFNPAAESIFGFDAAEVQGKPFGLLMAASMADVDGDVSAGVSQTVPDVIGKGRELTALRKGGEEFPIDLALGEVMVGGRRRFIAVIHDNSEHRRIEQELRESEGRFRDLADSASDWFFETDADYRLTFVSERIANVLGVKPSAILGATFFDIGLGDGDGALTRSHWATVAAHEPFRDVVFHVGPETDARAVRISGIPIFDGGTYVGYRGIGVDVTRETAAERRAGAARQRLVDAIESIVDAIAVYDRDDRLVVCNSQYRSTFSSEKIQVRPGVGFEEVLRGMAETGMSDGDGVTGDALVRRHLAFHRDATGEPFIIRMADGRWFLSREYRTEDGGRVGVRTDITELKRREDELDSLRRRYHLILNSAGEGIFGLGPGGRITFANRTACAMLRIDADVLVGVCFHAFVQPLTPDGQPYALEDSPVARAYQNGVTSVVNDAVFWAFDETPLHVDYMVAPMLDDGVPGGAVVVFRDASLRRRYEQGLADQQRELERLVRERTAELRREVEVRTTAEGALRASRERLIAIADSLVEGILVLDPAGRLVFANAPACAFLGWDPAAGDIDGHILDDLLKVRVEDDLVGFSQASWRRVVADGRSFRDDDAFFSTADGAITPVAYACSPLMEDGEERGIIVSFRDIKALKHAQREALQSSRLATVGQLAAGIAHEINTPVQYVGDNLRFIGAGLPKLIRVIEAAQRLGDPEVTEAIAAAKIPFLLKEFPTAISESLDGVAQIARIVLSMKEFSHPGSNTKTMTDINRAVESTLTVSRNTWKHVAELDKKLDGDLPLVSCLAGDMNQVFLNLIINAAQAIEESGKPLPGVLSVSTARVGDRVEIRVGDTGSGIPDHIRDQIFDPFFTTKAVGKGTGQGLAICRDVVVTKHGGRIDVDSRSGEGAIFIVQLPINDYNSSDRGASD